MKPSKTAERKKLVLAQRARARAEREEQEHVARRTKLQAYYGTQDLSPAAKPRKALIRTAPLYAAEPEPETPITPEPDASFEPEPDAPFEPVPAAPFAPEPDAPFAPEPDAPFAPDHDDTYVTEHTALYVPEPEDSDDDDDSFAESDLVPPAYVDLPAASQPKANEYTPTDDYRDISHAFVEFARCVGAHFDSAVDNNDNYMSKVFNSKVGNKFSKYMAVTLAAAAGDPGALAAATTTNFDNKLLYESIAASLTTNATHVLKDTGKGRNEPLEERFAGMASAYANVRLRTTLSISHNGDGEAARFSYWMDRCFSNSYVSKALSNVGVGFKRRSMCMVQLLTMEFLWTLFFQIVMDLKEEDPAILVGDSEERAALMVRISRNVQAQANMLMVHHKEKQRKTNKNIKFNVAMISLIGVSTVALVSTVLSGGIVAIPASIAVTSVVSAIVTTAEGVMTPQLIELGYDNIKRAANNKVDRYSLKQKIDDLSTPDKMNSIIQYIAGPKFIRPPWWGEATLEQRAGYVSHMWDRDSEPSPLLRAIQVAKRGISSAWKAGGGRRHLIVVDAALVLILLVAATVTA